VFEAVPNPTQTSFASVPVTAFTLNVIGMNEDETIAQIDPHALRSGRG
jgi:hypothetical protein